MTSTPSGSPPPDANAIPFAELLAELRRRGFGIGLHDYKDVARLAARWQGVDRATFRDAFAALLARNADEVQGIRDAFDEWMDVQPPPPPPPPPPQPRVRTWHVAALVLLLAIGGAGGAWWWRVRYHAARPVVVQPPGHQAPAPSVETPPTPPPTLPDPPRKAARELPWLAAAGAAAAALVALALREARAKQKQWAGRYWRYVLAHEEGPHHYEPRVRRPAPALPRAVMEEVATILGRARETDPADGDVLDVEESLRRTLGAGMAPHLVFAPPPRNVPVLVLQDVAWQMRPWAAKVDAFAAALRRRGVLIERWYFDGDPLHVSRAPHGRTIALESLSLSRGEASLLVLSGGQGIGAASLRALTRLLATRWRFRTWIHPVGNPAYWRRELASLPVRMWPMTPAGVRAAAVEISRKGDMGVAPKLAPARNVTSGDVERMRQLLAMTPNPTLELAEELRRRFAPEVPEEVMLFLGADGVFYGETIAIPSDQLQRLLAAAALDPVRERNVRRYLLEVLHESQPAAGSAAHLRWQLDEAVQLLRIDPDDASARDTLQSLADGPLRDEVHAAVSLHGLGVEVKDRPVTELPATPPRSLGKRPPLWAWPRLAPAVLAAVVVVPLTLVLASRAATGRGDPIPHQQGALSLSLDKAGNLEAGKAPIASAVLYRGDEGFSKIDLPSTFVVEQQFRGAWFQLRAPLPTGNLLTSDPVWVPAAQQSTESTESVPWIDDDISRRVIVVVAKQDGRGGNAPPVAPSTRLVEILNPDDEGAMQRLSEAIAKEFSIMLPSTLTMDQLPTVAYLANYVRAVVNAKPAMGTVILTFRAPGGTAKISSYELRGSLRYTGVPDRALNVEPGAYAVFVLQQQTGRIAVPPGGTVRQTFRVADVRPNDVNVTLEFPSTRNPVQTWGLRDAAGKLHEPAGDVIRVPAGQYQLEGSVFTGATFSQPITIPRRASYRTTVRIVRLTPRQQQTDSLADEAMKNIDWSIRDTGTVECPDQFAKLDIGCTDRSCVMSRAIREATTDACGVAFELTLVTQCHNAPAQDSIRKWGQGNVCTYLKSKRGPTGE